jgi:hypothetical protein
MASCSPFAFHGATAQALTSLSPTPLPPPCPYRAKHRDSTLPVWVEFLATVLPARIDAACWVLHTLASRVDTLLAFMGVCPVANVRGGLVAICVAALKV